MLNRRQVLLALMASVWSLTSLAQQAPLPVIAVVAESRQIANPIEALGTLNANETAEIGRAHV